MAMNLDEQVLQKRHFLSLVTITPDCQTRLQPTGIETLDGLRCGYSASNDSSLKKFGNGLGFSWHAIVKTDATSGSVSGSAANLPIPKRTARERRDKIVFIYWFFGLLYSVLSQNLLFNSSPNDWVVAPAKSSSENQSGKFLPVVTHALFAFVSSRIHHLGKGPRKFFSVKVFSDCFRRW